MEVEYQVTQLPGILYNSFLVTSLWTHATAISLYVRIYYVLDLGYVLTLIQFNCKLIQANTMQNRFFFITSWH